MNISCEKCDKRLGRYLLLDHLVTGGMAKIYRARRIDRPEVDRIVAIKVIQQQLSHDESFRNMFMSEIKVAFGLIHPNVAQTYDYGMYEKNLFIAMEYIDGKNLHQFLSELRRRNYIFPVDISVYIISQICQGLHYAHTHTDKLVGKDVSIIHRDVSPHNIMISYDGAVKLIDFGIAKTEMSLEATSTNIIKGKLPYIAPEYLEDKELDGRYDEFSLGITLWEMLCNKRLFSADHDLAILKKIQECKVAPPSTLNPNVPKDLDEIILKVLSRNRDDRYENLDKLNRALVKFLYSHYPDFNPSDLSFFASKLFEKDIERDRKKLYEYGKIDLTECQKHLEAGDKGLSFDGKEQGEEKDEGVSDHIVGNTEVEIDTGSTGDTGVGQKTAQLQMMDEVPTTTRDRYPVSEKNGTATGTLLKTTTKESAYKTRRNTRTVEKEEVREKKRSSGLVVKLLILGAVAGGIYLLLLEGTYKGKKVAGTTNTTAADKKRGPEGKKGETLISNGKIFIPNYQEERHSVFIDGKRVKVSIFGDIEYNNPGQHTLRVQQRGYQHFITKFALSGTNPTLQVKIPKMPEISYGYLTTSANCVTGTLFFELFGEERREQLPVKESILLPVRTRHEMYYTKGEGGVKLEVAVEISEKDDVVDFCELIYGW